MVHLTLIHNDVVDRQEVDTRWFSLRAVLVRLMSLDRLLEADCPA